MKTGWGYGLKADRQIVWDENDHAPYQELIRREPSADICIQCGTCTATCTSGLFTSFSLRHLLLMLNRGELAQLKENIRNCMFCGKCQLVCPRGVNTRNVLHELNRML